MTQGKHLLIIYETLNRYFGDLRWWPGETPFEVIAGAILTQNTNWGNVKIAIDKLKSSGLLSPEKLLGTSDEVVAELIRSSGYYNVKTRRLKAFLQFLCGEYEGDVERMFEEDLWDLRDRLLGIKGIGEETADSILLYAGNKPVFVVDLYTRRILQRHNIINGNPGYGEIQKLFMDSLPSSTQLFNQYHALLVNTGKYFCKTAPRCRGCPLGAIETQI